MFTRFNFDNKKIYVFQDVPHIMNRLRIQFIDRGFQMEGKIVDTAPIFALLEESSAAEDLANITENHITVHHRRDTVKMAAELFSNKLSEALVRAGNRGLLHNTNWKECAELLKTVSQVFY